jgi:hypothetical protein
MYSTIKPKMGICGECEDGIEKPLTKGKCQYHYWQQIRLKSAQKSSDGRIVEPVRDMPKKSQKIQRDDSLEKWFAMVATFIKAKPYCMECGCYVPEEYYRHATAHIFPKNIFKSVATHPMNYLILPAGCCHDKTHTVESFSKMKVWSEAVRRFKIFEPLITEKHKYLDLFKSKI